MVANNMRNRMDKRPNGSGRKTCGEYTKMDGSRNKKTMVVAVSKSEPLRRLSQLLFRPLGVPCGRIEIFVAQNLCQRD
jgi:hypothetical protein